MNPKKTPHARLTVEDIKALWMRKHRRLTTAGYLQLLLQAMAPPKTPIRIKPKEFCEKFAISRPQFFRAKAILILEGLITEDSEETILMHHDEQSRDSQSQERDSQSQERDSQSQERDSQSQKRDSQSQKRDSQSQKRDSQSQKRDSQSQKRDSDSPQAQSGQGVQNAPTNTAITTNSSLSPSTEGQNGRGESVSFGNQHPNHWSDPFYMARRGHPAVVTVKPTFRGPWGEGYTEELASFEAWLRANKSEGKHDLSAWIAAVVNGIAKGGSRALWDEFKSSGVGNGHTSQEEVWGHEIEALLATGMAFIDAKQAWLGDSSGDERKRRDKFAQAFLANKRSKAKESVC